VEHATGGGPAQPLCAPRRHAQGGGRTTGERQTAYRQGAAPMRTAHPLGLKRSYGGRNARRQEATASSTQAFLHKRAPQF